MIDLKGLLKGLEERATSFEIAAHFASDIMNDVATNKEVETNYDMLLDETLKLFSNKPTPSVMMTVGALIGFVAMSMKGQTSMVNAVTGEQVELTVEQHVLAMFKLAEVVLKSQERDDNAH